MKIRLFILGICAGILFLNSCEDGTNLVGGSISPDEDGHTARSDKFVIQASTFTADSVYARTLNAMLGKMEDPLYGTIKSDYLFQFYCPDNYRLSRTPKDGVIDSVKLITYYTSWTGDSIANMVAEVYRVNKNLDRNFYSNINPADYYDSGDLVGKKAYTARNYTVSDSLWNVYKTRGYYPLAIDLPASIGQEIYDATINNPEVFKNQDAFNDFFKGFYLTTDESSQGNLLDIGLTSMELYYQIDTVVKGSQGQDSAYVASFGQTFTTTKEVIQLNRYQNIIDKSIAESSGDYTYIKSPAGLFTKLTIPTKTDGLIDKIKDRTINSLFFSIKAAPQEDVEYALNPPTRLLLLPKDSMNIHFEKNRLTGSAYLAYLGTYSSTNRTYDFGNIANIIAVQMEKNPDKDIEMVLVPVDATMALDFYGRETTTVEDMTPLFTLSGAKLITNEEVMEFSIASTKLND